MAKSKAAESKVASSNPDDMIAGGGLRDDFDGLVTEARFVAYDYEGKADHPALCVAVTIQPDPTDEDPEPEAITEHYSAGSLEHFVPSMDGEEPAGSEEDGYEPGVYAIRVGTRPQLANSTNYAHFVTAALDADFPRNKLTPNVDGWIEGIYGHWNRVPQKKRSGMVAPAEEEGSRRRERTILVLTELKEKAAKAAKAGKAGKVKAASKTEAEPVGGDDMDEILAAAILEGLAANDGRIKKVKLASIAMNAFNDQPKLKGKAVTRVTNKDFLSGRDEWEYDADEGVLTLP